jgi:hypothetical protein
MFSSEGSYSEMISMQRFSVYEGNRISFSRGSLYRLIRIFQVNPFLLREAHTQNALVNPPPPKKMDIIYSYI